jgi:ABC-2 type transport system permease protein
VSSAEVVIGRRAGWRVVAAKELADHMRSVRLLILTALISIAGIVAVYAAAGGITQAAERASGSPAVFLRLFTVAPQRIPPFYALIGLLGPLLGIAFGFDAVNGERSQGTLPRLISQPIYRDDVINGKFAAGLATIALVLGSLTVFVGAVGMLRIGVVPSASDVVRVVAFLVLTLVYVGFWLAFSTLCSVWLRRGATSALASISTWLVLTLFATLLVGILADVLSPVPDQATLPEQLRRARLEQTMSRISPSTLYEDATIVLLNPQVRSLGFIFPEQLDRAVPNALPLDQSLLLAWPQLTWLVVLTFLSFAGAYVSFMRQEVRA